MDRAVDPLSLAELLAEETRRSLALKDVKHALTPVTDLAVSSGLADWAGVTQRVGKFQFETVGATDALVNVADRRQYELDEGPCVRASYDQGFLVSEDPAKDERWPRWGPAAVRLGIGRVMSVHLYSGNTGMGALNLYSARRRKYTQHDLALGQIIGAHASITLSHFRGEQHLWKAIDARHVTGIAQGILCRQYGISPEKALNVLLRTSQHRNVKVHVLATEIIAANSAEPLHADKA